MIRKYQEKIIPKEYHCHLWTLARMTRVWFSKSFSSVWNHCNNFECFFQSKNIRLKVPFVLFNVCFTEKLLKCSTVLLQCLVSFSAEQTLYTWNTIFPVYLVKDWNFWQLHIWIFYNFQIQKIIVSTETIWGNRVYFSQLLWNNKSADFKEMFGGHRAFKMEQVSKILQSLI